MSAKTHYIEWMWGDWLEGNSLIRSQLQDLAYCDKLSNWRMSLSFQLKIIVLLPTDTAMGGGGGGIFVVFAIHRSIRIEQNQHMVLKSPKNLRAMCETYLSDEFQPDLLDCYGPNPYCKHFQFLIEIQMNKQNAFFSNIFSVLILFVRIQRNKFYWIDFCCY